MLGTPDEETWPGVTSFPDFKSSFPQWAKVDTKKMVPGLEDAGIDLLEVRSLIFSMLHPRHAFNTFPASWQLTCAKIVDRPCSCTILRVAYRPNKLVTTITLSQRMVPIGIMGGQTAGSRADDFVLCLHLLVGGYDGTAEMISD